MSRTPTTLPNISLNPTPREVATAINYLLNKIPGGSTLTHAVTFNNSGTGAASGTVFDGSTGVTISYNTIGAQVAGSYLTANQTITISGDIAGSGTTAITATLATVNASPGTFGDASHSLTATVNGKGLITSLSSQAIAISNTQVSGLGYFATGTDAANLTGTISVNRFNSGTGASTTTFLRGDGTWATPAYAAAANPTATASDTAVNGTATTYMRSDAAPAVQKASSSQFGIVKVDGTSITSTGGVISAAGGGGTTTNAITWNNTGLGAASGTTFNGSTAVTVSYNTVGAQGLNTWLSELSWAPDPYYSNVVFLSGFEGANNSTTFTDEGPSNHALTASGNAKITTTGAKFGSSCATFDGSGDFISTPDSADWDFGSGQFTIEGWFNFSTKQDNQALLGQWDNSGNSPLCAWFLFITGGALTLKISFTGFVSLAYTWAPTLGTWYHIAADRDGAGKTRLYINGAMVASSTGQSGTIVNSTDPLTIGAIGTNGSFSTYDFNGQMDEIRITKGAARYATDVGFTAPTMAYQRGAAGFFYQSGSGAGVLSAAQATVAITAASGGGTTNFLRADGAWASPPGTQPAMVLISKQTPSGTGTVSFTSIPQTYTHLMIISSGRTTSATTVEGVNATFNSDTAAHYDFEYIQDAGASASGTIYATTAISVGFVAGASATAGYAGYGVAHIFNYTDTNLNKMVDIQASFQNSTSAAGGITHRTAYGGWRSSSAITRIDLTLSGGNWVAGSVVSLYGIN